MIIKNKGYFFVFCLAGLGNRFKEAGVIKPKYLLEYKYNQSLILEEIISAFNFDKAAKIKFFCNERDKSYKASMLSLLSKFELDYEIKYINDTRGQAETAYLACKYIKENYSESSSTWPIVFFNGDTILKCRNLKKLLNMLDDEIFGLIDCFNSDKNNYSYVNVDKNNIIKDIREKVVISNFATSGLYIFLNPRIYIDYYKKAAFEENSNEKYISDIYKHMIRNNVKIKAHLEEDMQNTIILGTPEEYKHHLDL